MHCICKIKFTFLSQLCICRSFTFKRGAWQTIAMDILLNDPGQFQAIIRHVEFKISHQLQLEVENCTTWIA